MRTSDLCSMAHMTKIKTMERSTVNMSLVQDTPQKRKWNGVKAKYNETITAIEKQKAKFLEEAI
jgi:hypothetical protein